MTLGYAESAIDVAAGNAVSDEGRIVQDATAAFLREWEDSESLYGKKDAAIAEIVTLAEDCGEEDWDGAGAAPVHPEAVANAVKFVRALASSVPMPEIAPEPDGNISLEWIQSRHRMITASVGISNRIAFAWLDGTDSGHGVTRFDGLATPQKILQGILSIVDSQHTSFRAA